MGRRQLAQVSTVALTLVAFAACAATPRAARPPIPSPPTTLGWEESGEASWYGRAHQGRPTASGEPYDMRALTAAHRTLPLGTRILVTHVASGRTVEVRINDRGPHARERLIDVSEAAARELGMLDRGLARVSVRRCARD
jgi:rare lipoprotein A